MYKCHKSERIEHQGFDMEEQFEDTKGAIRSRKSKKYRQHNDQKKEDKRTNNDVQISTQ